jgi:hypothetical protein
MHLGGEEISVQELKILTHQAKDDALELHAASMSPKMPSPPPIVTTRNAPSPQVPQYPILPPGQIKSSLKMGKFHPVIASTPPPRQIKSTSVEPDDEEDDPSIYSKTINGVGDETHLITASFIKTNNKIRDQVLNFCCVFLQPHACKYQWPQDSSHQYQETITNFNLSQGQEHSHSWQQDQRLFFYTEPVLPCPQNPKQTKSFPPEGRF